MNFKSIKNEQNEYTLFIDDEIGNEVDGKLIAREINNLDNNSAPGTVLRIKINSVGGSVFHGYQIVQAILSCKNLYTVSEVVIAMSIASVIALSTKKTEMVDFGILMVHDPYLSGGGKLSDSDKDMLNKVKNTLITLYTNRTRLSEQDITEYMSKETYFDANEALDLGIIDKVITTSKPELANKFVAIVNKLEKYNSDNMNTEEKTEDIFTDEKLSPDTVEETTDEVVEEAVEETTDEVVEEAVEETTDEVVEEVIDEVVEETTDEVIEEVEDTEKLELQNKLDELQAKVEAFEAKEKEALENKVTTFLSNYKETLSEQAYDKWMNLGLSDFDFVKESFEKLTVNKKTIKVEDVVNMEKEMVEIDIRKMEKEDPRKLAEIKKNNPLAYSKAFKKAYGVEYTEK